eukprot:COSAG06_NODE_19346_length_842_cov_4.890983_2_plen_53_part_01
MTNFSVTNTTADAAVLVFEPSLGPGLYSAYYLTYVHYNVILTACAMRMMRPRR